MDCIYIRFCCLLLLVISTLACQQDGIEMEGSLDRELQTKLAQALKGKGPESLILPASDDWGAIPQDSRNPLTAAKVHLGEQLFHETGMAIRPKLAINQYTYSCASCHHAAAGFQAGRIQGIGEGGRGFGVRGESRIPGADIPLDSLDVQPIRSPSVLNVAFQEVILWNGQFGATGVNAGTQSQWTPQTPIETNFLGYQGVETQAIAGLTVHRLGVEELWALNPAYLTYFDAAFPEVEKGKRYTLENAGLAIAAYERSLLTQEAPFQRWLKGEKGALSIDQKQGAILFFGKAGCYHCHHGPALNSMTFHVLGMNDLKGPGTYGTEGPRKEHLGRGGFTGREEDMYAFKTPQLYNLQDASFLGHGASFSSIEQVVRYKNYAIPENLSVPRDKLSPYFQPLRLTEGEIAQLTNFLTHGLYDPALSRYQPEQLPTQLCFPNNDLSSRRDMGCQ